MPVAVTNPAIHPKRSADVMMGNKPKKNRGLDTPPDVKTNPTESRASRITVSKGRGRAGTWNTSRMSTTTLYAAPASSRPSVSRVWMSFMGARVGLMSVTMPTLTSNSQRRLPTSQSN